MPNNTDEKYISYALNLSRKNLGLTAPNPCVGCVIVGSSNNIISTGITAPSGRPHAENIAISKVKDKSTLRNSTLYVTLEPCFHHGQTTPCVDEIIKYGIKKVVIAAIDPDQRVNSKSIKKLQEHNIEVITGICEKEAEELNRGFFKAKKDNLPFITLKLATSLDGKIATKNFDSKWITNQKSRQFSHHLRSINDAILVGAGTVRADNPSLNCRIAGLENSSPKKIIISNSLNLAPNLKIFEKGQVIILNPLNRAEAQDIEVPNISFINCTDNKGKINLKDALKKLCENGINSVLIEGGSQIISQFLQENLIDELIWMQSSKIIGNDGLAAIGDLNIEKISSSLENFTRTGIREFGDDLTMFFRKKGLSG